MTWVIGLFFALIVAMFSYKFRLLTLDGSVTALFLGWLIFSLGGLPFSVPILAFFVFSSLLTKVGKTRKKHLSGIFEKTGARDAGQVLANGLIPALILLVWYRTQNPIWIVCYLAALASAAADTWATELGVLSKSDPRSILNFRKVEPGTSGGVSGLGMSGAILGALLIATTGFLFNASNARTHFQWRDVLFVTVAGVIAQTVDSFLGASCQATYRCRKCHQISEKKRHCNGAETRRISGHRWINNDVVNVTAVVFGVLMGWLQMEVFS